MIWNVVQISHAHLHSTATGPTVSTPVRASPSAADWLRRPSTTVSLSMTRSEPDISTPRLLVIQHSTHRSSALICLHSFGRPLPLPAHPPSSSVSESQPTGTLVGWRHQLYSGLILPSVPIPIHGDSLERPLMSAAAGHKLRCLHSDAHAVFAPSMEASVFERRAVLAASESSRWMRDGMRPDDGS